MDWNQICENIDIIEEALPLPLTEKMIEVGRITVHSRPDGILRTYFDPYQPQFPINAVNAILVFTPFVCSHWDIRVKVLAKKHIAIWYSGQSVLKQWFNGTKQFVEVGPADYIEGEITAHDETTNDPAKPCPFSISIPRSEDILGVGTFKIPILPTAILYCPPQGVEGKNYVDYCDTSTVGTTMSTSFQTEESTSRPTTPSSWVLVNKLVPCVEAIKKFGSSFPVVKIACDVLLSGMGTATASETKGEILSDGVKAIVYDSEALHIRTKEHDEPGRNDYFNVIKNAKVGWWSYQSELKLTLLGGGEAFAQFTISDLLDDLNKLTPKESGSPSGSEPYVSPGDIEFPSNTGTTSGSSESTGGMVKLGAGRVIEASRPPESIEKLISASGGNLLTIPNVGPLTGLAAEYIKGLLSLDPFVLGGKDVKLDPARFIRTQIEGCDQIEATPANTPFDYTIEHTITNVDSTDSCEYKTNIEEYHKGWLLILGYGVDENKKVVSTAKYSVYHERNNGNKLTCTLHLELTKDDGPWAIIAFFDRAFGTFAFQRVATIQVPWYSDTATDKNGNILSDKKVVLKIGDKKLMTRTDKFGKFAYYSAGVSKGRGKIKRGDFLKNISYL